MSIQKYYLIVGVLFVLIPQLLQSQTTMIPLNGNAYITAPEFIPGQSRRGGDIPPLRDRHRFYRRHAAIDERSGGISGWSDTATVVSLFFRVEKPGNINVAMRCSGHSEVNVSLLGKSRTILIDSDSLSIVGIGRYKVKNAGYVRVDFRGERILAGNVYGNITDLLVEGSVGEIVYIAPGFSTHFGRRGPSVHLKYSLPKGKNIEWFYNEVTVPEEGDVPSSYYMACGFGEGYFGMQNNTPSPRRVLFSVWSPYETDNAADIPDSLRVVMLKKGDGVTINDFGGEGSGGQSFLLHEWKAGKTYKFLMGVKPDGEGNTIYTAYFFNNDEQHWQLVASFRRPEISTWYSNAHSFLENFNPNMGYKNRSVFFDNQWARTADGEWLPVDKAYFTHDNTGREGKRLDFKGGVGDKGFYLSMGGFFDDYTAYGERFVSETNRNSAPDIDFSTLE